MCSPERETIEVEKSSWIILAWLWKSITQSIKACFRDHCLLYQQIIFLVMPLLFLASRVRVRLKETAQKKNSVLDRVPRQLYISFLTGCRERIQKFYMACGIYRFPLFSFRLPNSSLIVLFINNIRFHKQLSVASMFWIPWQKDDQKKSCERPMRRKVCHFHLDTA